MVLHRHGEGVEGGTLVPLCSPTCHRPASAPPTRGAVLYVPYSTVQTATLDPQRAPRTSVTCNRTAMPQSLYHGSEAGFLLVGGDVKLARATPKHGSRVLTLHRLLSCAAFPNPIDYTT